MRTLVISDIHGNIEALKAVIAQPFDNIVCMGDIVDYGPDPGACVDLLLQLTVFRARGNHDHAVAFCVDCQTPAGPYRELSLQSRSFTASAVDEAQKKWLGDAETAVWADHGGLRLFACHGAPSDHMYKYMTTHLSDEDMEREMALVDADIVLVGHTHKPFIRKYDGRLLVNVGSVGQPRDGITQACYAVIEDGEVEIRRTDYDLAAVIAKTRALPLKQDLLDKLVFLLEKASAPPFET